MEIKTVNLKDIKKDNPQLCLSALRAVGQCYKCPQYRKIWYDVHGNIHMNNCKSRIINEEFEKLQHKLRQLKNNFENNVKDIETEIKNLDNK